MKNETYIWDEVLDYIRKHLGDPPFCTWFKSSRLKIEADCKCQ